MTKIVKTLIETHSVETLREMQDKLNVMFVKKNAGEFVSFSFEKLQQMEQELTEAIYIKVFG